jgi:hypothetical protein
VGLQLLSFCATAFSGKQTRRRPDRPGRPGRHGVIAAASDGAAFSLRCRGAGFAVGVLVSGLVTELLGLAAIWLAAGLTGLPGLILAARRYQPQRRGRTGRRPQARPQP